MTVSLPQPAASREVSAGGQTNSPLGRRIAGMVLAALALSGLLILSGCGTRGPAPVDSRDGTAPVPAGYYRVRGGDSLSVIAERQGVPLKTLADWNGLQPPYPIRTGSLLRVVPNGERTTAPSARAADSQRVQPTPPPATGARPARSASPEKPARATSTPRKSPPPKKTPSAKSEPGGLRWQWPLKGRVVQGFEQSDQTRQGIRIAGRAGQQVLAAEGGTVVYSGSGLKGYGNLIIVKHNNEFLTAYGFNQRLLLPEGKQVTRGQPVAEVGQTAGGQYLLHFEVRRNGVAVNPLRYLPGSR